MHITYFKMDKPKDIFTAEGKTLDEVINNIKITKVAKKSMLKEMPENYTIFEVALYIWIMLGLETIEVKDTGCGCTDCGCSVADTSTSNAA